MNFSAQPHLKRAILISLLLIAFALRLHKIDHSSMWVDEGASISVAHYPVPKILESRIYIQDSSYRDSHPPLYYLILSGGRRLLGESDFSYRYISVIFSLLSLPLIFKLGEKLHSTQAGLIAVGLDSVIPISIQYAQEARMYTLVVFLALLFTYKLLKLLENTKQKGTFAITTFIPIAVSAALLAFANYSAWFFLGCQGMFVIWWGWRLGYKRHIVIFSGMSLMLITLFWLFFKPDLPYFDSGQFDPWLLAHFAQRLLDNTFTLSAAPNLMGMLTGSKFILGWLIYFVVVIGIFQIPNKINRLVLLVHWLAIPVGLFLMELMTPGFQKIFHLRHVLLSSSAIVIFTAVGLATFLRSSRQMVKGIGLILLSLIIMASAEKTAAYYPNDTDGSQKDDYRLLVESIMQQAGESDIVIFNNAARLPLYDHYQYRDELPITALPNFPYPASDATLKDLEILATQHERIWFVVGEPIAGLDEDRIIQKWLEANTDRIETWSFYGHSTSVGLIAFSSSKLQQKACFDRFEPLSDQLAVDLPAIWLQTPAQPSQYTIELRDSTGHVWSKTTLESVHGCEQKAVTLPSGLPHGRFQLINSHQDQPITWLDIAPSTGWSANFQPQPTQVLKANWEDTIQLKGIVQSSAEFWPGTHFSGQVVWENGSDQPITSAVGYKVQVLNSANEVLAEKSGPITAGAPWPAGSLIATPIQLFAPADWLPGAYQLEWQIEIDGTVAGGESGRIFSQPAEWIQAGTLEVDPWPLLTHLPTNPEIEIVDASFGKNIRLHGFELHADQHGEKQQLDLIWKAKNRPAKDYLVFIHVFDKESGLLVTQQDRVPVDWWRPTSGWRPDEVLIDSYNFDVDLTQFDIIVGLYATDTQERLPVIFQEQLQTNNQLKLEH